MQTTTMKVNTLLQLMAGNGPTLLGRNWLEHIQLYWKTIDKVNAKQPTLGLEPLLAKHAEIFIDELGTIQPFTASLQVRSDISPKFCKARSVIECDLEHLESYGILEKVDYSEWAAPIVAVPKKDGKVRICGDYKFTVNQALEVDQYPLPKPGELFASLAGGKIFSKLDLSQAYQQLLLDEESRKYVTIITHRGLYHKIALWYCLCTSDVPQDHGYHFARNPKRDLLH